MLKYLMPFFPQLWHPFDFNERVSAICLTTEERKENLQCNWVTAIGWGHTKPGLMRWAHELQRERLMMFLDQDIHGKEDKLYV
jgi:hypothetical protein